MAAGDVHPTHDESLANTSYLVDVGAGGAVVVDPRRDIDEYLALAEQLPVDDGWADLVISNGVINLVPDKLGAYREIARVLKPGGRVQVADICVEKPVPESALRDIDLWTG